VVHDLIFFLVALGFFAAAVGFVHACGRLVGSGSTLGEQER
jgi:hypothetical protein